MKNNFFIIFFSMFFFSEIFAENMTIEAKNISFDKNTNTTIFEKNVIVKTTNKIIKSEFAKYYKNDGFLIVKENISILDNHKNTIEAEYAEYFEEKKILKTKGKTKITTNEKYVLDGKDITLDNQKKIIFSKEDSFLIDGDQNKIFLNNFEYFFEKRLFKSIGFIKIEDKNENLYEFSQIYIDTKKNEILGTDAKTFLNQKEFKVDSRNKPRIFSNTMNLKDGKSSFTKNIFTLCGYREGDKCPPWTIQSKKMLHDNVKKTIFYEHALIKVYSIPIFYIPRLSHPDPTVERRSGFLPPTLYNSNNLGSGISVPYFFDLGKDKNLTFTNRIYASENPLFIGEYHQALKDSDLLADFGFTEGYKNTSSSKKGGEKSHFFAKFVKNFTNNNDNERTLNINLQDVSQDKYLKLYKIDSNLVDYNSETLENSFDFLHQEENLSFSLKASVFETLSDNYEDKYEFILPEVTLDKNLLIENFGSLSLQTNYKVHNYDTNKLTNFLVNDFNWESNGIFSKSGINSKILGNVRNINYESKNIDIYKENPTSELFGSLGFLSEINFTKFNNNSIHYLKPKFFTRFAPGSMRKETEDSRLNVDNAFALNRVSNINNYETGLSGTLGLDYEIKNKNGRNFDFSLAQIINEKANNHMPDKSSLNEKVSDLVGSTNYSLNDNFKFSYDFGVDQNYQDLNFSELGLNYNLGLLNINFDYLREKKHMGNQDYFKTEFNIKNSNKGELTFETKRNLITDSSEFYNLSYEYINDCLRAGLVYRREFYNDSEIEPEDSLMFKITLVPFGNINTPKLGK